MIRYKVTGYTKSDFSNFCNYAIDTTTSEEQCFLISSNYDGGVFECPTAAAITNFQDSVFIALSHHHNIKCKRCHRLYTWWQNYKIKKKECVKDGN